MVDERLREEEQDRWVHVYAWLLHMCTCTSTLIECAMYIKVCGETRISLYHEIIDSCLSCEHEQCPSYCPSYNNRIEGSS